MVLDAAATVAYLVDIPPGRSQIIHQKMSGADGLHVPHLLDVEVTNALRRLVLQGPLAASHAEGALQDLLDLPLVRYPHHLLLPRVWELRHNLTAYDATYVALAEVLALPLLTLDPAMRDAPGHHALVEVV